MLLCGMFKIQDFFFLKNQILIDTLPDVYLRLTRQLSTQILQVPYHPLMIRITDT